MVNIRGTFIGITHQNSGYDDRGRHWKYYDIAIKDDDLIKVRTFSKVLQTRLGNIESGDIITITNLKENGKGLITTNDTIIKKIDKLDIIIDQLDTIIKYLNMQLSSIDL